MIGIERWLDVLSLLVIAGIVGVFLYSARKRGVRTRSLSEKPALFLEFTGKQVSVRRNKSKIVPSYQYREQAEARITGEESPETASGTVRISRTVSPFKDAFLAARENSQRLFREGSERARIIMTDTARQTMVISGRIFVALRSRVDAANRARVEGLQMPAFRSVLQERITLVRRRVAGAPIVRLGGLRKIFRIEYDRELALRRLRQAVTDVLLSLDYRWYRVERSVKSHSKQLESVKSRIAKTSFKGFQQIRAVIINTRNGLMTQGRIQNWLGQTQSAMLRHRQDLITGCRTLQRAVHSQMRRLSQTPGAASTQPQSLTSASPDVSERIEAEPVVLSLTSSGTLKLRTRLEDEWGSTPSKSAVPMTAAPKSASSLSQVSVRYVGAHQRRYGDPAENRQSKQAVK